MNVGGPAVQISGLMRGIDPGEFNQVLVTGHCDTDEADYLDTQAPDVPATRIEGLGRAVRPTDDVMAIRQLARLIRDFEPDIIHTHTAKAGLVGRVAVQVARSQARVVHTYHGHLLHGYFSPAKTRAVIALERTLAKRTDRLVAVGFQVRDDLLAAGIGSLDQFTVIPPGLTLGTAPSREQARADLGIPGDTVVISMIGRLTGIKRVDRFADVVARIKQRSSNVTFLVAGEGSEAAGLGQRVSAETLQVRMLGWRSDVERLLAASDALVLTSDNEGTPLSLIQAALAGLPVVATNVGSVSEVVLDGETGLLCDTDSNAIAEALTQLIESPDRRRRMGARARRLAESRYGVSRLVADHEGLYRGLVDPLARP